MGRPVNKMSEPSAAVEPDVPALDDSGGVQETPALPSLKTIPILKKSSEQVRSEIEAMLSTELRNVFEVGADTITRMVRALTPALTNAVLRGDKQLELELQDQIDAIRELGRINTMKSTNRMIRGVLGIALKAATIGGGL